MKLYALAFMASRKGPQTSVTVFSTAATAVAVSEDEARGLGHSDIEKVFPRNAGYYNHQVAVMDVPQEYIDLVK